MSREMPGDLCFQPLSCFMMLTGGAVAVSTGLVDDMRLPTVLTFIDGDAGCLCAAI